MKLLNCSFLVHREEQPTGLIGGRKHGFIYFEDKEFEREAWASVATSLVVIAGSIWLLQVEISEAKRNMRGAEDNFKSH